MTYSFFDGLYSLQEIGIYLNFTESELKTLTRLSQTKKLNEIKQKFKVLEKFLPYCKKYRVSGSNVYAMPMYIFDTYIATQMLPSLDIFDKEPEIEKLEYWKYNPPFSYELDPRSGWDFALSYLKNGDNNLEQEDVWKIFMSGCARMNYYQEEKTDIEQRIRFAILEYMLRRPQFFTSDDFVDNPLLHKKYKKGDE